MTPDPLLEHWLAFYRAGGGDVAAEKARLRAAGADRREINLARDHASEIHLWGGKMPPCSFGTSPEFCRGANEIGVKRSRRTRGV